MVVDGEDFRGSRCLDLFFTFGCQWLIFCVKHEVETLFESQSQVHWWE